jgi:hypothetical protein
MIFSSAGGWDLPHSSPTTLPMPWEWHGKVWVTRQSRRALDALAALLNPPMHADIQDCSQSTTTDVYLGQVEFSPFHCPAHPTFTAQ